MSVPVPADPPIFHITHTGNLASIARDGGLWCDAQRLARGVASTNIAHLHIKQRRLSRKVETRAGGCLGDYVPFYFCPRSVMLYAVACGHASYPGGQDAVVHLVSSVRRAVALGQPWSFSDRHAELAHALHYDELARLDEVDWRVMGMKYWKEVREERQAEFLVREFFPLSAFAKIGTRTPETADKVRQLLGGAGAHLPIEIRPDWYYEGLR